LGTIEFRVCDVPSTVAATLSLVAFIRSLVVSTQRLLEERPHLRRGDMRRHWIAVENKWLATRYGLEAMYIRTPGGKRRPLKQDLSDLLRRLLPIARENGDESFLTALLPIESFESGADRQRRLYRESGLWRDLIADMTERLSQELEPSRTAAASKLERNSHETGTVSILTGMELPSGSNGKVEDD
jgi:carboxylate-amine ligase